MKIRLPLLPLFVDEIERLNHFIDVLNALDQHVARPQRAHVYAAWRSTINDRDSSYLLGRNVFVHASVPKGFYQEFVQAYANYGHTPMARYARLNPTPELLTWREHRHRLKLTRDGLWFHELAERYGMLDGLYCSHWQWTIGFWTRTIFKPTDGHRKILDIAAYFAAARMEKLMAARKKKLDSISATLSPREQLSLIRYSLGDSEQEIADRLGVSTGRVNNLLNAVRKKLKAKSRPHAVRIAVLARIIP
ncbi:MAG TPA: helix-turn-helix transcriptional regulator [Pseudolabrys sp.]|nr:helix-turn-helix transcriptional regulator [Pseudolabrys sp.]